MRRGTHADSGHRRGGDVGRQARGAAGARRLSRGRSRSRTLTLVDLVVATSSADPGYVVDSTVADLAEPGVAAAIVAGRPDVIFHLAAVVSGEAEDDLEKGYRVNLDATRMLLDAVRACDRRLPAARGLQLVDRRLRAAVARGHRRRPLRHARDELRHAEGDDRAAAVRPCSSRLRRWHRHPPADDLRAAGQAEPRGVGVLLEHHPRAAERSGRGVAGARRRAALVRVAARGDRLPRCTPRRSTAPRSAIAAA